MLITLGFVLLLIGVVLVVMGYTVAPQALRPAFGCIILAVVLILLGYLLPAITTHDTYEGSWPASNPASTAIQP